MEAIQHSILIFLLKYSKFCYVQDEQSITACAIQGSGKYGWRTNHLFCFLLSSKYNSFTSLSGNTVFHILEEYKVVKRFVLSFTGNLQSGREVEQNLQDPFWHRGVQRNFPVLSLCPGDLGKFSFGQSTL